MKEVHIHTEQPCAITRVAVCALGGAGPRARAEIRHAEHTAIQQSPTQPAPLGWALLGPAISTAVCRLLHNTDVRALHRSQLPVVFSALTA